MSRSQVIDAPIERVPYIIVSPSIPSQRFAYHAFQVLRAGFALLPILTGVDKVFHYITNWDHYLAPVIASRLPIPAQEFMQIAGGIEIFLGLMVAFVPRIGGYLLGVWLLGITANLLLIPGTYDVALRDFGLALGAFALGMLARSQNGPLLPRYR